MKYKKERQTDYRIPLFVGCIVLLIGIRGFISRPDDLVMNIVNTSGAFILLIQALFYYKKGEKLAKDS